MASTSGVPLYASRAAAMASKPSIGINRVIVTHGGEALLYQRDPSGTALTTADGAKWSPAGDEIWDKHFGSANDGVSSDRAAAQAAIDWWNGIRATRSATLRFSTLLYLDGGLNFSSTGAKRGAVLGSSGGGMPCTEVRVAFHGYGSGAGAPVFAFGDTSAPAYQSGVEIGGFLFTKASSSWRAPIGISGAALAQSTLHDITFGAWDNEAISLLTPQNLKGENIVLFGGGRSFAYKDASAVTVTQSGTTLTASGAIFSAADVGKTVAIWGVAPSTYRRKALITAYTSATQVTVAESITDAVARRLLFSSPFITATASSTTITADAACFSADMVGLPVCIDGAGRNGAVLRAKIAAYTSATQVTLSAAAVTSTTQGQIATAAMCIHSPASFGNGASDIRFDRCQIESHTGVGLVVDDADILHWQGKLHAEQSVSMVTSYSQAAIWARRWEGVIDADLDAQYLGPHRVVIGDQTSSLRVRPMRVRSAINERSFRIRTRAAGFEGSLVTFDGLYPVGASGYETLANFVQDDNTPAGHALVGAWSLYQADAARFYLGDSVSADLAGNLKAAALNIGSGSLKALSDPALWTPVVADAASGGNVASVGSATGMWMRVGALIALSCRLINISTSGLTGGNSLYVRGFPNAVRGSTAALVNSAVRADNITLSGPLMAFADDTDAFATFYMNASGAEAAPLRVSALTSGSASLWFSLAFIGAD